MFDRLLKRIGDALHDDDSRRRIINGFKTRLGFLLRFFLYSYGAFLLLAILGLHYIGENNITSAFALYVPRVLLLLPLPLLLFLSLFNGWKSLCFLLISTFCYGVWGMGYQMRTVPEPLPSSPGESITVLTYNRGQHMGQSLQPFKNQTRPDIIALQEAPRRARRYLDAEGYEAFEYAESIGEFTVLSRYPISDFKAVEVDSSSEKGVSPAARFEIEFPGRRISLYVIHVVSPRDTLLYYRRGAFLQGILGVPGTHWGEKRKRNQTFWDQRIQQAIELKALIDEDPLPTLVVGDLNAPSGGVIHGIFRETLADAHIESGSGFGYTFPGVTRNPLSRGGPWMRIDYLFCDVDWEPVWCVTEEERKSQHRAVTAQFRLLSASE